MSSAGLFSLSLHDALPISVPPGRGDAVVMVGLVDAGLIVSVNACVALPEALSATCTVKRSEEHTSELQSHHDLVCRLLLEKKKHQPSQHYQPNTADDVVVL